MMSKIIAENYVRVKTEFQFMLTAQPDNVVILKQEASEQTFLKNFSQY